MVVLGLGSSHGLKVFWFLGQEEKASGEGKHSSHTQQPRNAPHPSACFLSARTRRTAIAGLQTGECGPRLDPSRKAPHGISRKRWEKGRGELMSAPGA